MNKGNIIIDTELYQGREPARLLPKIEHVRLMDALGKNHEGMNKAALVRNLKALTGM